MNGYLLGPIVVSVVSAIFAAIIAIVDGIVNNYGEVNIDINNGKKNIKVKGGSNLLVTLASEGIFVPSACGGRGSCGACKTKVLSDVGPLLPTETPYMSPQEIKDGIRLACQVKLKSDIKIEIPDELFYVKRFDTVVESIRDMTYDIKEVRFKLLSPDKIEFRAGQYVQISVPPYEQVAEITERAYSMASKPGDDRYVELLIRLVPGGLMTTYIHKYLKVGEKITLKGPFGDFYLRDTTADMICVAGGSGMAPLKSIIFDMYEKGNTNRNVWYFFGARAVKDIYYVEEMKELEKKWDKFHFIPALSAPEASDNWTGDTGLITQVLDKYLKTIIPRENEKEGYLCGSPGMIDASIKTMIENSIKKEKIYYDKF